MYFNQFVICILLLCNVFALSSLSNDCSAEYCNFAGECSLIDKKPNCKCYTEAFHGPYCEKVKDLCQTEKNTCTIRESCVPYIDQTFCDCRRYNCKDSKINLKAPTKPMCSYNVRAVYGTKQYFVLSFEELGTLELDITVSTATYLIGHVGATVKSNHTKNLTATLDVLGIRRHMKIPYNNAWYYLFEATYFTTGVNQLTVDIKFFDTNNHFKQTMSLMVYVALPRSSSCLPQIVFRQCMDPKKPRQVNVEHFTNIQAIVEKRCYPPENTFRTQWTIFNFEETISLYSTSYGDQLLFKIPHYSLWYEDLLELYPNILLSVRLAFKEINTHWTYSRCYLNVTARNVVANIAGGHSREVNQAKWLTLDGSKSCDPARRRGHSQQLKYTWLLSSEDGSKKEYLSFQSNHAKLHIPAKVLNKGVTNRITLKVTSRLVPTRSSSAIQMIRVVTDRYPISLDIECIRNCQYNLYNNNIVLHLRAICSRCRLPINYTWTLNGVNMRQDKPRLVTKLTKDLAGEIVVTLNVTERTATGYTELKLQKSQAPTGGNCVIEPKSGVECITRFHVRCEKAMSRFHEPILYTFRQGKVYVENNNSGETFLYLNGMHSLTVGICGFHLPCAFQEIFFTVKPMPESDRRKLLNATSVPSSNLEEGRTQQAFCILQMISAKSDMEVMLQYIQAMKFDRTFTLIGLVNTLEIAHESIINVAPLSSYDVFVISYLLERVVFTFDFIRRDNEILDMTEDISLRLGALITEIVKYCVHINENLGEELIVKDFDDPFSEANVDWSPFNISITQRINRYAKFVELIFKIQQMIAEESARYIQPEEPYDYVTKQVSLKAEMYEKYEPILYTSNDTFCIFEVPLASVQDLRQRLKSNVLMLYTWCFKGNIFWWAPEDWAPTTAVLAINIYGRNGRSAAQLIDSDQSYKLSLRRNESNSNNLSPTTDILSDTMVIYKVKLHGHVNLLIDFLNTTKSLRVLITMNVEPTLNNLHEANCFVPESQRRSIVLKNRCHGKGIAYIAVCKDKLFDSSRVTYTFRMSAQECGVWGSQGNDLHWMSKFCYSQNLEQNPVYSNCTVKQLSVFSAKEYPIKPFPIQTRLKYAQNFPLNVNCIVFHILFILGTLALLILAKKGLHSKKMNLIRVIKSNRDEVPPESENIIVHLNTGGMLLAKTTANIKLVFESDLGRYKVLIYQNPIDPQLDVNTTCTVRLSDEKVQLPCRVTISHDLSGRYPSWHCRSLQVDDLRRDLSYTFPIHTWIKSAQKMQVSCYPTDSQQAKTNHRLHLTNFNGVGRWKRFKYQFKHYIEISFINWFMFQPIFGPWQYGDDSYNIYGRICIWISKTVLIVTLVFCYYRKSTSINYFDYENKFTSIEITEFLALALASYFITIIYDIILMQLRQLLLNH